MTGTHYLAGGVVTLLLYLLDEEQSAWLFEGTWLLGWWYMVTAVCYALLVWPLMWPNLLRRVLRKL